jgi:hypothetical protein
MSEAAAPRSFRPQKSSPASIGILLAIAAALLPLFSSIFFFFFSLPFLIAAFVLAVVSLVRGAIVGGIILLIMVFFAAPISFVALVSRSEILKSATAVREKVKKHEPIAEATVAKYQARTEEFSPSPTESNPEKSAANPQSVILTQSVSIKLPFGNAILPAGTKLQFISRNGETLQIRYVDADYEIPISATDLK